MNNKPLTVALTGSIAMGKSTAAAMFEDAGIAMFDADATVHILQGPKGDYPKGAALDAIESAFPGTCDANGVDRQKLSQYVLGNLDNLNKLESILHPLVNKLRSDFLAEHKEDDILLFDIPLLFEKGGEKNVDKVVVVSAPADVQRNRALARPNMTEEKFNHILSIQISDAIKCEKADYIINSAKPLEDMRMQIENIVKNLYQSIA